MLFSLIKQSRPSVVPRRPDALRMQVPFEMRSNYCRCFFKERLKQSGRPYPLCTCTILDVVGGIQAGMLLGASSFHPCLSPAFFLVGVVAEGGCLAQDSRHVCGSAIVSRRNRVGLIRLQRHAEQGKTFFAYSLLSW